MTQDKLDLLIDLHQPNPRQGPGGDAQTELALRLTGLDPAAPLTVADIGCGTGAATLALARLQAACEDGTWSTVNEAHADLHEAIVAAAHSPRIAAAHAALSGEMRLFLLALQPHVPPAQLARDHAALVRGLERDGPPVLREHLRVAAETLVR